MSFLGAGLRRLPEIRRKNGSNGSISLSSSNRGSLAEPELIMISRGSSEGVPVGECHAATEITFSSHASGDDDELSRLSPPSACPDDEMHSLCSFDPATGSNEHRKSFCISDDDDSVPSPTNAWIAVGTSDANSLVRVSNDDLQEATLRGDLGLVRRLIRAGASVNAPVRPESEDEYMSLLHILARKPEMMHGTRIIAEIIKTKANLNVRSSTGVTPLSSACLSKHIGAVEVLLEAKADPTPIDDYGRKAARCAVLRPPQDVPDAEALSVEVIELLIQFGANLDDGGDVSPMVDAVRQKSVIVVRALIQGGAEADGLHDAVESGPVALIQELVKAEANPFRRDANGKTVMDLALARGEEAITTILRDFIGDLQRNGHKHLKTLEEQRKLDAEMEKLPRDDRTPVGARVTGRTSLVGASTAAFTKHWLEDSRCMRCIDRLRLNCRRLNRNKVFQGVMFAFLILALFLPDSWVIMDIGSNDVLDAFLVLILLAFMTEFIVQVIGLWRSYLWSFFFWMDLVGILSVPLDHSLVTDNMPTTLDNAVVMRAARMAKLGARAGRFTKLVKLLRFLPGMQMSGNSAGTAKVISATLNMALSTRVSCLIIVMVMILPLLELITYPENDFSMKMWTDLLTDTAVDAPDELSSVIESFKSFYTSKQYRPYEVHVIVPNGTWSMTQSLAVTPVRPKNRVKITGSVSSSYAMFNFTSPNQIDSLCSCCLMITIMVLMLGAGLVLSNSVSAIVLVPLELLLSNVKKIASKIFNSVATMAGKAKGETETDDKEDEEDEGAAFGNETELLERVLKKLSVLSEITVKKSPIDVEAFEQLNENDRAVLQGYSSQPPATQMPSEPVYNSPGPDDSEKNMLDLQEIVDDHLSQVSITWESFESWDFNVMELTDQARQTVCLCILHVQHEHTGSGVGVGSEWSKLCSNFLEDAAKLYGNPKQVPFHNWSHAVDVTFTLFRLLNMCATEHYLGAYERFALAVAAVGHDISHPGLNNLFMCETSHELAIRYNDSSPLENMHCAVLFELVRRPSCAIFGDMQQTHYREVRHLIIEAILHTDFAQHFTLVKEIQTLYEMNADLFDTSEEAYHTGEAEFPSKEVVDFLRGADVKKPFRLVFLHFSDVAQSMKTFNICESWASLTVEELFLQGDTEKELNMPVQPLGDREKVNKPYSQVAFTEFFVSPLALSMARIVPPLELCAECLIDNMWLWFDIWCQETQPRPDQEEQNKVRERITKVERKHATRASIQE